MEYMYKIKDMLCKELKEYAEKEKLSAPDLEMIHKLSDTIKNLDKIDKLEDMDGYSNHYPMYDDRGSSYARRGTHYVRGHYSRDDDGKNYSEHYGDRDYDRRYSMDKAKDHMMSRLGAMMEEANPTEREALKKAMREIENA